jgi:hypothetical protein
MSPMRAVLFLLVLTATAWAQQVTPQPKVGSCPAGYRESGGYYPPLRSDAPAAISKGDVTTRRREER